tara:strand:+ start:1434 stop:2783 length:1350 start_codon:yes stop_codon:yes gene_type:complete
MAPNTIKGVLQKKEEEETPRFDLSPIDEDGDHIKVDIKDEDEDEDEEEEEEDIVHKRNKIDDDDDDDNFFSDVEEKSSVSDVDLDDSKKSSEKYLDGSDKGSNVANDDLHNSVEGDTHKHRKIYSSENHDITSESDIDNGNSTYNFLLSLFNKINKLRKRVPSLKFSTSFDGIHKIINKILSDIRVLRGIDLENKKILNALKVRLIEINRILTEDAKKKYIGNEDFNTIYEELGIIYNDFKTHNYDTLEKIKKDRLKMNIDHERDFNKHLQQKLSLLSERLDLLQMKYNGYKKWFDRTNITIIIISTVLSVFESFRLEIQDLIDENNHALSILFNMTPIVISSTITCSAAIIKFKKYQEKMENMQFTREKVITSISRIEQVKESLWFNNEEEEFIQIKENYLNEVFTIYNESITELKRHIKFDDHHKFDKHVNEKNKENNKNKNKNMYI